MRKLGVAIATAAATGCAADAPADMQVSVDGVSYELPAAHVRALTLDPHQFVRMKPPGVSFELIYDSRSAMQVDARGWPVIFSLNDGRAPGIHRYSQEGVRVVCRRATNPLGGCGIRVEHRGANWTVLFPISEKQSADTLLDSARGVLDDYAS